jgi:hypothetical protein
MDELYISVQSHRHRVHPQLHEACAQKGIQRHARPAESGGLRHQEGIRELTKPLFSIPPTQFLFNAGNIDKRSYMETLQLEESEYNLIKLSPARRLPLQVRQRALPVGGTCPGV